MNIKCFFLDAIHFFIELHHPLASYGTLFVVSFLLGEFLLHEVGVVAVEIFVVVFELDVQIVD